MRELTATDRESGNKCSALCSGSLSYLHIPTQTGMQKPLIILGPVQSFFSLFCPVTVMLRETKEIEWGPSERLLAWGERRESSAVDHFSSFFSLFESPREIPIFFLPFFLSLSDIREGFAVSVARGSLLLRFEYRLHEWAMGEGWDRAQHECGGSVMHLKNHDPTPPLK